MLFNIIYVQTKWYHCYILKMGFFIWNNVWSLIKPFFFLIMTLVHTDSHHGVAVPHEHEEIQNFNVMAALPSTIYNMPLSSQYFFHPHI